MAYKLIEEYEYTEYSTYTGKAEKCVWDFKVGPEQFPGVMTIADTLIAQCKAEIEKDNGSPLLLRVYADTSPIFETRFRVIAYAYTHSPLHWMIVLGAVMIAIAIVAYLINWTLKSLSELDWAGGIVPVFKWWAVGMVAGATALGIYLIKRK